MHKEAKHEAQLHILILKAADIVEQMACHCLATTVDPEVVQFPSFPPPPILIIERFVQCSQT